VSDIPKGTPDAVSDFGFSLSPGLRYRVIVRRDLNRGGWSARLISEGIGTIMEPNGTSPADALTRLAKELSAGDATDRKIAREIVKHAWFPLKVT
jgi:hypothetical protein